MYALFERQGSDLDNNIHNFDGMGIANTEFEAMEWRDQNPEHRVIKYVPSVRFEG